jgi:peptidoglycan L-alanyl-D-glutamate endopeptidase CwlK
VVEGEVVSQADRRFSTRSRRALAGVHPDLVLVVSRGLLYSPHDFAVTEGLRSVERQRELVIKGWSRTYHSRHLLQPDGYGHAVDIVAVGDLDGDGDRDAQDRALTWDRQIYTQIADGMARAAHELGIGIRWGGEFRSFFDGPHFELLG